jgi:hypothetical protein
VEVKAQWTHRKLMALAGAWRINKADTLETSPEPNGIEDNAQHYENRQGNDNIPSHPIHRFPDGYLALRDLLSQRGAGGSIPSLIQHFPTVFALDCIILDFFFAEWAFNHNRFVPFFIC